MPASFYYNDPKYFICCGNRHIKTAFAIIVAFAILGEFSAVIGIIQDKDAISVLTFLLNTFIMITLCIAYKTENEKFLYPYAVFTALALPLTLGVIVYLILNVKAFGKDGQAFVTALIATLILANLLNMFFLYVVYKYYYFLIDLRAFRLSQNVKPAISA